MFVEIQQAVLDRQNPVCLQRPSLRTLAATIKARWICEQAHQQLKEELGLVTSKGDPGKSPPPCAHEMLAFAFLEHRRLKTARREKRINGPSPQPSLPSVRHAILALIAQRPSKRCPHCRAFRPRFAGGIAGVPGRLSFSLQCAFTICASDHVLFTSEFSIS